MHIQQAFTHNVFTYTTCIHATRKADTPSTRSSAKVNKRVGIVQEIIFLVELHELERGTRAKPVLLCQVVESEVGQ